MKRIIISIIVFFLAHVAFGQNIIDKHFQAYKEQDNFTSVHVSSKMFELATYIETEDHDEDFEELKEFISTIKSFDMIVGSELTDAKKKYTAAYRKVEATHEELMSVDDKEGSFKFFIDESNGVVKEVVMVGSSDKEFMVFSLIGAMDLKQLGKLTQMINADGFQQMNKMFDHGVDEVKVYPNPLKSGSALNIGVPSEMIGGTATLISMNGTSVKTFEIKGTNQELNISGVAPGSYVVNFKKDQVSIKKRVVVQ